MWCSHHQHENTHACFVPVFCAIPMPSAVLGAPDPQKFCFPLHPSWEQSSSPLPVGEEQCRGVWGAWGGRRDPGYMCFLNSSPSGSYFSTAAPSLPGALGCQALCLWPSLRANPVSAQPFPGCLGLSFPGLTEQ